MDKILIVTLPDSHNFGNRLQNYALTTVVSKMGFDVFNLVNYDFSGYHVSNFKLFLKMIVKSFLGIVNTRYKESANKDFCKLLQARAMNSFSKKYIGVPISIDSKRILRKQFSDYKKVIVGSDQVWHDWTKQPEELSYYYLSFVPREKRVAYAASFGFDIFDEFDKELHIKGISGIDYVSCREESGCVLIQKYINKDTELVLDPTLLLTSSDWEKIEKKPKKIDCDTKYSFSFFLGKQSDDYKEFIQNDNNKEVNNICFSQNDPHFASLSPSEFVYLIHHAEKIYTDSFHAVAFSIVFSKEFLAFQRNGVNKSMFSRITNLLSVTNNLDKIYTNTCFDVKKMTFRENSFNKLKSDSFSFLKRALES